MALPASGIISMDDIRAELGVPSQAPFNINDARLGTYVALNPYSPTLPPSSGTVSLASWYSYCHTCTTLYSFTVYRAANQPGIQNFTSAANACFGTRDFPFTVVSSSSTLGVGSTLYSLSFGLYQPFNVLGGSGEEQWIYDDAGSKPIRMTSTSSNVIDAVDACATVYTVRLDNSTGTICGTGTSSAYTSGGWGIGVIVYSDAGLTTPITGYNYIVNVADNIIYEINVSTGEIQADSGLTC